MKKRAKGHKQLLLSCEKVRDLRPLDADQLAGAAGGGLCVLSNKTGPDGCCFSKPA